MRIIVMGDAQTRDVCFPAFVTCFNRIWPQDDVTTELRFVFSSGLPTMRCTHLYHALEYEYDHILLLLIDYLLVDIEIPLLERANHLLFPPSGGDVGFVRLLPCPGPTRPAPMIQCRPHETYSTDFGQFALDQPYLFSLQATIWKPQFLRSMLEADESVWDLEFNGSKRLRDRKEQDPIGTPYYLGTTRNALSYKNLYRRGQLQEDVWKWYQKNIS